MSWRIEQSNGIYLPQIDWHLDARKPVSRAFVSHAHFDHMGNHEEIVCTPGTAALMQRRIPGNRNWRIHEFETPFELEPGIQACLYPAGHITGSAMLWLKSENGSFLYTGDFKLSTGSAAETCKPVQADTLIIETTYGIPRYTFPPESEIATDIVRFCKDTLDNGDSPVLYGYSLGKSQSILRWLADSGLTAMLHPKSLELTRTCEELGWKFPPYIPFADNSHQGHVIISPPLAKTSNWLKRIRNPKTAIISGWAIDPSAKYRYQCDKAFPLSDHADYLDLQSFVAQVQPTKIYTVHGFAQEFAQTLREQGYNAIALGKENQLGLNIVEEPPDSPIQSTRLSAVSEASNTEAAADSFAGLAALAERIASTDSRSKKTEFLSGHLKHLDPDNVAHACQFLSGLPIKDKSGQPIDNPKELVLQAVLTASKSSLSEYKAMYQASKDRLSTFAQMLVQNETPAARDLQYIRSFLFNFAAAPSPTFRFSFLSEEIRKLSVKEVLLLIRIIEGNLRIGLEIDIIETAIANRFKLPTEQLQRAHRRCSNLDLVISAAADSSLSKIRIHPFKPVPLNCAYKTDTQEELFERIESRTWVEDKFDGLRCQIHKSGEHAELYDKDLKRITHQFPELVEAAKLIPQDFIADAEIVPWGYERPLPRKELEQRLQRRGEDLFLGEETEVQAWLFDLLWLNDNDLLDLPLSERRKRLDTFSVNTKIRISPVSNLENPLAIDSLLAAAHQRGNAGLICKSPEAPYDLGLNSDSWLSFCGTI